MITSPENTWAVGKYLVSPYSRLTDTGRYAASVSIRSGHGSGTHAKVFRFHPQFPTRESALHYALAQGREMLLPEPTQEMPIGQGRTH